ncbi:MAG: dihydropteroate synthase [Lachnospiraceae bacterium]|jgi:5-methyltetrahydrofolate--homocysteine methyltransferase|nr:dihydropteroate synthase [Lachnospiraceae bacterium]
MIREEWKKFVKNRFLLLDGATGTNLQKAGMPTGVCPEQWILEHKEVILELQKNYVEAGTDILYAPTFSGNRIKLEEYGLADRLEEINQNLVMLTKEAAGNNALVAGDITMTGKQLYPIGELYFEELVEIYKEQIRCMVKAGVDLLVAETIMSLQEARAAVLAAKEVCDLPIMVTMTFQEDGRTLYGTDPKTALIVLQSLGADAVGVNCSAGPDAMISIIEEMKKYAVVPLIAKPNAGLPKIDENGKNYFDMDADTFADFMEKLAQAGAAILGGCCGTTPEYIKKIKEKIKYTEVPIYSKTPKRVLCSERKTIEISLEGRFFIVGERINPTGKKKLQQELKEGKMEMVLDMAAEQEEKGAAILDINMGMNGIDEKEMMIKAIYEVSRCVSTPLCIDSSHVDIIEAALRIYPGRALINSISLEKDKMEHLLPIAKKYGAMFILLPLSDKGLPENLNEKIEIINTIIYEAQKYGLTKEDIVVDGLVATIGANPNAARETLETIRYCKEQLQVATITGLSNISFGLPDRISINTAFLTMAVQNGLTMAIANPSQDLLVKAAFASDLLLNKTGADIRYINKINSLQKPEESNEKEEKLQKPIIYEDVLKGNREIIVEHAKTMIEQGKNAGEIINEILIPAINEVGRLFDKKIYFLPQLISSAEAMKTAIEYLEPLLEKKKGEKILPTIVFATVKGDIHDIGKNLVVLMLKNYGYRLIDLGKDVPKEEIVETAIKENAQIIGLSALMTTTMMEMKEVVMYAKERKCRAKIMIGGAVITESFAEEIGADGYSKDAADAVKLVERLLS